MQIATRNIHDQILPDYMDKKWTPEVQALTNVWNACESFSNAVYRDIQKKNATIKERGMSYSFTIDDKYELPPFLNGNRKFVIRTWCGMGRIMVHIGEDVNPETDSYVSMVGAEEEPDMVKALEKGKFTGCGTQGMNWDSDAVVFVLHYIVKHWWEMKDKLIPSKTVSMV